MIECEGSHIPEVYLWRAVITQAIADATMPVRPLRDRTGKDRRGAEALWKNNIRARDEARTWLLRGGKNFRGVCEMALLDPDAVRDAARALSRRDWPEPTLVVQGKTSQRYKPRAA